MMRLKIIQSALMLAFLFGFNSLSAENHKEERVNNEFKLLVTSLNSNATLKLLKLNRLTAKKEVVYYFDTQDKQLQSQNLILMMVILIPLLKITTKIKTFQDRKMAR